MAKISQIKPQKNKRRFNIYLNDTFGFSLSAEALVKANLKLDQELTEEEINNFNNKNQLQKLYDQALRYLSFRPRSEKEIKDYLQKKIKKEKVLPPWAGRELVEIRHHLIEKVIDRLKEEKLIDDLAFASWWCQQRADFRPRGEKMLMAELRQKGISHQIAQSVVSLKINEEALARKLILKKEKFWKRLGLGKYRQKLTRYLYSHGFSWSTIKKIIDSPT